MATSAEPGRVRSGGAAGMGRGGALNVVGALFYQASLFAVLTMLARLGEKEVGRYTTCFALLSLLSLLSLAGFRAALTRFVAIYLADGDAGRLRGVVRLGLGVAVVASLCLAAGLALLAPHLAALLSDPGLEGPIRQVALTLPAVAAMAACLAATQGWRSQKAFTLVGRLLEPLCRLGLTVLAIALGAGLTGALWALVVSSWVAAVVAWTWLRRRLRSVPRAMASYDLRGVLGFSVVSWVSALAATGLVWVDVLLLGALQGQEDVGSYGVATRLVTLAVFVMAPLNAAFTPHMAHLFHTGRLEESSRAYGTASRWILLLSMPAFVLLVTYPAELLAYFGPAFSSAAVVTAVLAVGQLVNAAAGPCGTVLNMSGHVRMNMADNVAVLTANVVLNLVLVPRLGILGAALAWSISLVVVNVVKVAQARYVVGVRAAGLGLLRLATATAVAAVVALLLRGVVDVWTTVVLVAAPAVTAVFAAVVIGLGLGPDDARLVRSAIGRLRHRRRGGAVRAGAISTHERSGHRNSPRPIAGGDRMSEP